MKPLISKMSLEDKLKEYQARVEIALDKWLPKSEIQPTNLHEAMRYAVLSGGKRIRPILVYATGETFGVNLTSLDGPAVAVELIHAYSLIHDDLPAMDNDNLRRGVPTCHKAFGVDTAILAGDAIQALSFYVLANNQNSVIKPEQLIKMISCLAEYSGSLGMAGGQAIDIASVGKSLTLEELEKMHKRKTGALIRASVEMGALSANGLNNQQYTAICDYADNIGLAFQIQDDILDIESDTSVLGKPQGSDIERNKPTYPKILGLDGTKEIITELHNRAIVALDTLDINADYLRAIANYIVNRNK